MYIRSSNQNFDDYVLSESKILKHDNLKVLDNRFELKNIDDLELNDKYDIINKLANHGSNDR